MTFMHSGTNEIIEPERSIALEGKPVRVYIVDYIGSHCGIHYYNDAFLKVLSGISGVTTTVLSNYSSDGKKPFFHNFYIVNKAIGVVLLLFGYARLFWRVLRDRNAVFVVISFGNQIDMGMMWIASFARRSVTDVHEVITQREENKWWFRKVFGMLYRRRVKNVIIHSGRSADMLDKLGYEGRRFYVPHFRYGISKQFDAANVGSDVADSFDRSKTNMLFFGNIMYNKGIDLLVDAVNSLTDEQVSGVRVVVAGKVTDDTINYCSVGGKDGFRIIARHINDDELAYLYSGTDYVILPYRKTSQSGILEMAFHFRKPVIAARLPYFESILKKYPSFGVISRTDVESLSTTITECAARKGNSVFFKPEDIYAYEHGAETDSFAAAFGAFLTHCN